MTKIILCYIIGPQFDATQAAFLSIKCSVKPWTLKTLENILFFMDFNWKESKTHENCYRCKFDILSFFF